MKVPRIVVMAAEAAPTVMEAMGAMQAIWGLVCWGDSRGACSLTAVKGEMTVMGTRERKPLFIEIVQS